MQSTDTNAASSTSPHCSQSASDSTSLPPAPATARDAARSTESTESLTALPWGFVAVAAAAFFLFSNKDKLVQEGGFIFVIGAIVIGVMSANTLADS